MVNIVSHMERFSWGMASFPHSKSGSLFMETTGKDMHWISQVFLKVKSSLSVASWSGVCPQELGNLIDLCIPSIEFMWISLTSNDGRNRLSFSTTTTFLGAAFSTERVRAPGPGPTSQTQLSLSWPASLTSRSGSSRRVWRLRESSKLLPENMTQTLPYQWLSSWAESSGWVETLLLVHTA